MAELDKQNINVLNYNENEVFVDTNKESYRFSASRDGINPSIVTMPLSELQFIASNTSIITTGWLTFDDEYKEEIYKELRIHDWQKILTNKDIEDIITKPTIDGLQKIIDIDSQTYFDRIRMIMHRLINDGIDVTTKVKGIVDQRYTELQLRQRKSSIVLTKKDTTAASINQVKELSAQNAALQSQLDEMKAMMAQLMAMQTAAAQTPQEKVSTPTQRGKSSSTKSKK